MPPRAKVDPLKRTRTGRPYFFVDFGRNRRLARARQPHKVLVRQKEYKHDAVVLRYDGSIMKPHHFRKGTPVALRWGWAPKDIETYYGYVHSTRLVRKPNGKKGTDLEVYLVSASHRLNKTRMRSFRRMKVGAILYRITRQHRFSLSMDPSSRFHRHIPQLGQSDWNLMVRLARDIGFTLSAKRTQLQFKRRLIDSRPNGRQPTFRWYGGYGPMRGSLYEFVHKAGTSPLARNRRLVVGGMDDNGKPFWATDGGGDCCDEQPEFTEYYLDEAPGSIHEGKKLLSGLSGMNRFYVIADAVVSGFPKLRCGQTIRLLGSGQETEGYWWVGAVDHMLEGPAAGRPISYKMALQIGRETINQVLCVDEEPPTSWSGKPEVADSNGSPIDQVTVPEVPTIYNPADDCTPIELPGGPGGPGGEHGGGRCHCPPKKCPGSRLPLRGTVKLKGRPRLDRWGARVVVKPNLGLDDWGRPRNARTGQGMGRRRVGPGIG